MPSVVVDGTRGAGVTRYFYKNINHKVNSLGRANNYRDVSLLLPLRNLGSFGVLHSFKTHKAVATKANTESYKQAAALCVHVLTFPLNLTTVRLLSLQGAEKE